MGSNWKNILFFLACFVSVNLLVLLVMSPRRQNLPLNAARIDGGSQIHQTPYVLNVRTHIQEIERRSFDELVENMSSDAVYAHTGLLNDDRYSSNLFFDAVMADRNNRRLIYEIGQRPAASRVDLVLKIFDKHFDAFKEWKANNTSGIEEVASFLKASGKQELTRADFFGNMSVGANKFPEGWNRIRERSHAVLSATFLVATHAGLNRLSEVLMRCYELQFLHNKRLESVGYPDVLHGSVGVESEYFLSVLWYGSDEKRCDNDALGKDLRRIIADSIEQKHLKRIPSEMVGWDAAIDAYDLREVDAEEPDRSKGSTQVDVFRWTCSEENIGRICGALLERLRSPGK